MAVRVDSRLTCIQATVASALPGLPTGPTLETKRSKKSSLRLRPWAQESANIRFSPVPVRPRQAASRSAFSAQSALQIANSTSLLAIYPVGSPIPPGEHRLGGLLSCLLLFPRGRSQSCSPRRVGMVC